MQQQIATRIKRNPGRLKSQHALSTRVQLALARATLENPAVPEISLETDLVRNVANALRHVSASESTQEESRRLLAEPARELLMSIADKNLSLEEQAQAMARFSAELATTVLGLPASHQFTRLFTELAARDNANPVNAPVLVLRNELPPALPKPNAEPLLAIPRDELKRRLSSRASGVVLMNKLEMGLIRYKMSDFLRLQGCGMTTASELMRLQDSLFEVAQPAAAAVEDKKSELPKLAFRHPTEKELAALSMRAKNVIHRGKLQPGVVEYERRQLWSIPGCGVYVANELMALQGSLIVSNHSTLEAANV